MRSFSTKFVCSTIGDPDLRSPFGFDSGLCPSLRMTRGAGKRGTEVCVLGVRRSRPAVALRVRLRASPSAQDDTAGEVWQRKLEFALGSRRFLSLVFTLDFRRNFFSFKLIKKPSPVGEGGPRQWWMRSPRDKFTLCRHLIRQPAAATFSRWRRLSFVSALYVNKQCRGRPLHNGRRTA